jgi:hypothetical protein
MLNRDMPSVLHLLFLSLSLYIYMYMYAETSHHLATCSLDGACDETFRICLDFVLFLNCSLNQVQWNSTVILCARKMYQRGRGEIGPGWICFWRVAGTVSFFWLLTEHTVSGIGMHGRESGSGMHVEKQADRWTDRQTNRQRDRSTEWPTCK